MLTVKETPKEPCCEKCGQSLPQPPPLTISERIDRLAETVKHLMLGRTLRHFLADIVEVLRELEKRPVFNYTLTQPPVPIFPPTLPPNGTIPWTPDKTYIGDPPPNHWPTTTCRNTNEGLANASTPDNPPKPVFLTGMSVAPRRVFNDAPAGQPTAVSDATGYVEPAPTPAIVRARLRDSLGGE